MNFKLIKEKKQLIWNNFLISIGKTLFGSLDKIIIAPLLGFTVLGNYSLGYQFFSIINIIPGVAIKYLIAQDATGIKNKKLKKAMVIASIGMAIVGATIAPSILSYLFPKFLDAENIIQIISWAVIPITIQSTYYMPKLWAQERSRLIFYHTIIMMICQIVLILTLGTWYESIGIAIAFVISNSIGCVFIVLIDKMTDNENGVKNQ